MADDIAITPGSGASVATDDVGGRHFQRVKLALGADGTAADAPVGGGSEATAMRVTLANDSTGVISVDDNGGSITVDGSVSIAGTPAVTATLAAETTKVIGTVNISAAQTIATVTTVGAVTSLTNALPAGTNNIGDVDVLSVVPGTAATSLGKAEDAAHTTGDTGVMALSVRSNTAAATSGTDGDYQPLITDTNGRLHVIEPSAASALTALQLIDNIVLAEDAAHVSGDPGVQMLTVRQATAAALSGTAGDYQPLITDGNGRLYTASVSTNSSGTVIDPQTDDAAFTPGTSLLSVVGGIATSDSVDSGDAGAFAMTLSRAQHTTLKPDTTGGLTPFFSLDIDESEEEVKATAGKLYFVHAVNLTDAPLYLKFYNATAASVTVGTTTPVLVFPVVSQGTVDGAGFVFNSDIGFAFGTAITVACTTGVANSDTGAPGANACVVNIGYN